VLKAFSADQSNFVAALLISKVISYYGGIMEQQRSKLIVPPEYPAMDKMIQTAVKLDPYNMDAYYFGQAILALGAGQIREMNALLEYGMRYRDWDFYLPSFAAFNYAYFLKDYANAAKYYKRVGDLTGDTLSINLAGRYMYESGRTEMAVQYLSMMVRGATNPAVKKTLETRLQALEEVRKIEKAEDLFQNRYGRLPRSLEELIQKRYLTEVPVDPYGGKFYLGADGKVRTTSKFAFGVAQRGR
jgi:tetratricopeptide (TPR) repeat protein